MDRKATLLTLAVIVLAGAHFRLVALDDAALRADSIELWRICQQPVSASDIFTRWMDLMGLSGQFPFPVAVKKWFLDTFSLSFNHFNLRLPSALWGIVTILAAYGLGRTLWDDRTGLLLAAMLAVNPLHIQTTREAYFYPPLVLGAFLAIWGAVWAIRRWQELSETDTRGAVGFVAVNVSGFFLLTYSQPTGWTLALVCGATVMLLEVLRFVKSRKPDARAISLLAGYLIVGLPLLFTRWGLTQVMEISRADARAAAERALVATGETMWSMLYKAMTSFAWGGTPFRGGLTIIALLAGMICIAHNARTRKQWIFLPAVILLGFLSFLYARAQAGALFESRYVLGLMPAYFALLTLGLLQIGEWLTRLPNVRSGAAYGLVFAVAILPNLYPALLCTQQTGQPTPYKAIAAWFDSNLPKDTPVLVDRWFEPWNELRIYNSTNVQFTFTIPNEPLDVFIRQNWRDTAKDFFRKHPDAAYLEISKSYWDAPGVGPWTWPRYHFARSTTIVNRAGLRLRELGLANRGDYYDTYTNRIAIEIFYNTREDLVDKARAAGETVLALYGSGWTYAKTQDYRDWRVLTGRATIDVYNLSDRPVRGVIRIHGVAPGGSKAVMVDQARRVNFPQDQMVEQVLDPVELQPGPNTIRLDDPLWNSRAQIPLLVQEISAQRVKD